MWDLIIVMLVISENGLFAVAIEFLLVGHNKAAVAYITYCLQMTFPFIMLLGRNRFLHWSPTFNVGNIVWDPKEHVARSAIFTAMQGLQLSSC